MMEFYSLFDTCQQTPVNTQTDDATSRVSPWLSPLAYLLGRHCLLPFFFGRIRITGQKNIPTTGPVIFAPTHRARWDALLVPYAVADCITAKDLRFMVTSDECQGLQGWFVRRLGGFPVNTRHPSIRTLRHGVELLKQRKAVVIFPEGNIYRHNQAPLKSGIARLALSAESSDRELGVKIVPISINYGQPYPSWGTDVSIHIGSPIKVKDYMCGCIKQDAKSLTADLAKALQQLTHQETEITNHTFAEITNSRSRQEYQNS
ncbi:MAG: 1-acyl-sn-glycerol-3-phosphate acyltransferase [Nostoc sp. ChiSLP02]|nr:1-acyl-sn-glycerol-3-phosphate acyltransferase [Nostoc sp. DedSLP05]MDZ8098429.1 1-acyl-sn-glycerol-3-phosphate acyltransferase [Nostoc sp. DedSLP01]MDZ8189803.1 1-acyl-sn-glycerol-3-phosphate acyltransferase [Nostoc sp. ChiSLP02]